MGSCLSERVFDWVNRGSHLRFPCILGVVVVVCLARRRGEMGLPVDFL